MRRANLTGDYGLAAQGAVFDPFTLTAVSMGATAVGGALTASSTLAGGDAAADAGRLKAGQIRQNAGQTIAASQRQMFDTQDRTRRAVSTSVARAGANGVAADTGSPLENVGELEQRGSYHALMDLFNGQSAASGMENEARAAEWEGEQKKSASRLAAAGTLAATAGSMASTYGKFKFPTASGKAGADL